MQISLAPIQGITGFHFRNTYNRCFKGVNSYHAPYIRLDKSMVIPKQKVVDLLPSNNSDLKLIPQVMSNDPEELVFLATYIRDLGYKEMNWNLGCPYPMVTKRKLGSGLIADYKLIDELLSLVIPKIEIDLSLKLRLGLENCEEIVRLIPILNKHQIKNVTLHPRLGKDIYKKAVDLDSFTQIWPLFSAPLIYNGDIDTLGFYSRLIERFPNIDQIMIGRGLIANPFLAEEIKGIETDQKDRMERFGRFHDLLVDQFSEVLCGPAHLISRMLSYWQYFSLSFSHSAKAYKLIKKSKSISQYEQAVQKIMRDEEWIA